MWLAVIVCSSLACSSEPSAAPQPDAAKPDTREADPAQAPEPEPEPDPEQARAAAVESLLATVDELAELHRRHAKDCAALAGAIETFHADHGAALASAPADVHAHIDANEPLRVRMRTAMEAVMSAAMACKDDPAFAATQAKLFGD
jgi:hypothetical protein